MADLDIAAARQAACRPGCTTVYVPYGHHAPGCRADDILELADELERTRRDRDIAEREVFRLLAQLNTANGHLQLAVDCLRTAVDRHG